MSAPTEKDQQQAQAEAQAQAAAAPAPPSIPPSLTPPLKSTNTTPRFSSSSVTVIFVLGGPGSGKGTQSANLVHDYGFTHLSAGDLLRAEQDRAGSEYGELIRDNIREGIIVPMEITVALLSNAMAASLARGPSEAQAQSGKARFLIDGFPRKMDQAVFFEETVCLSTATLFLECPEDVMLERLLKRGETSGRDDDNIDSIRKRFRVFEETSMPVVNHYEKEGKVMSVSSVGGKSEVYEVIRREIEKRGITPVRGEN
ncbi:hypothetical protein AJ80_00373 [Polytolypa hystricis UAMH7299]|uniref:Uridylate kinase n=1 Tax=Polytolypa hystricis (strain UAMH7299) TaxID=1447883 RepID=A0A2B7Z3L1_POLH7|nr:hypothetical protein AJ80_00373 [Polytolypa hystricis UAMH7299]